MLEKEKAALKHIMTKTSIIELKYNFLNFIALLPVLV